MKKWFSIAIAFVLILSVTACGNFDSSNLPQNADAEQNSDASKFVTTEEEVRALYEEDAALSDIQSITKYGNDFLVMLGQPEDGPCLDWVYGRSGIRRRMMNLSQELLDLEITDTASVKVITGGANIFNGVPSFPHVETVCLNLIYDEQGRPLAYDPDSSTPLNEISAYWANAGENWSMGMKGRREAIRSAQLDAGGVTVAFAPLADGSDFTSAYCEIPYTGVALSEDNGTLTITMQDTFLDSGSPADAVGEPPTPEYLQEHGSLYPADFPAGALAGSCILVEKAVLVQNGSTAILTLTLNKDYLKDGSYFQFTESGGYTGIADAGPYLRIQLRAANDLFD